MPTPAKPPVDFRRWVHEDQKAQDRLWVQSQDRQDRQLTEMAMAIRQYGVLIDALRDALGISPEAWEAAVARAIDRVEFAQRSPAPEG
jgi:hypothetical protein